MDGRRNDLAEEMEHFRSINEKSVDDVSLAFFYKPHTLTLLSVCVLGLLYSAFTRNDDDKDNNLWIGLCWIIFFFLVVSVLAFPNGPFTRPHPGIWRIVFGLSVLYFMVLVFLLFQNRKDVRLMIEWIFPDLKGVSPEDKEYAVNCSTMDWARFYSLFDCFAAAHLLGWFFKALLIRHHGILWTISITWEITEMAFSHLLPNFAECWWDAWVLDVLICNGLGIWLGMYVCRKLEMRNYHWESIKDIHSTTGKIRRAVLQFTPVSWYNVRWLDPHSSTMRVVAVSLLIIVWQLSELNTFFLKQIFEVPPSHQINVWRLVLISLISAPSIRQFYVYVTDTQCRRVGTQCWIFIIVTFTEAIICVKFGLELFKKTEVSYIVMWLSIQFVGSILCVYLCAVYARNWKWTTLEDGFFMTEAEKEEERLANKMADHIDNGTVPVLLNGTHTTAKLNGFSQSEMPYNLRNRNQKVVRNGHVH